MKNSTRNKINLIFSSFLVIGYIICSFFFSSLARQVGGETGSMIQAVILVMFGLLLFYATRVGEGKQVKRFSIAVLVLLVLPSAYIIAAGFVPQLPFHDQLAPMTAIAESGKSARFLPTILMLACIGLGYGVPYTFLSGYELKTDDEEEEPEEPKDEEEKAQDAPIEGGLAEELARTAAEEAAEAEEKAEEKAEETAQEAEQTAGDAAEEAADKAQEAAEAAVEENKTAAEEES